MKKSEIRKKIFKLRKKIYLKNKYLDTNKIINFLNKKKTKKKIIGGYYPYNYEIDILDILSNLEKKNYHISLPKIEKNNKMNFYSWSLDEPLLINDYGIPEPISKRKVYPEILLIPLVGFDNEFNRLGYGGGFYDRYLAKKGNSKKILKIGVGFSIQKVSKIPTNQYDVSLDNIITEKKIY